MKPPVLETVNQAKFETSYAESQIEGGLEVAFLDRIAEKALSILYNKIPLYKPFNLVVRWVEPGGPVSGPAQGLGDMANALKTIKLFRKVFPTANVFLTNKFYDVEDDDGDVVLNTDSDGEEYEVADIEIEQKDIAVDNKQQELLLGVYSPKALHTYLRCFYHNLPTVMFDVATPDKTIWPFTETDFFLDAAPKLVGCYHVDEYNGQRTNNNGFEGNSKHNWFSYGIGLDQKQNPSVGIHLDPTLENRNIRLSTLANRLENSKISSWIKGPLEEKPHIEREFYFGYSSENDKGQWGRFLNSVLTYESSLPKKRDVDFLFLTQDRTWLPEWWNEFFQKYWKDSPFKKIVLEQYKDDNPIATSIDLNPEGNRTIRVLQSSQRASHEDVQHLMQATGKAILVTGDQSWAEAVSLKNRVIFYEIRKWKKKLAEEMRRLAEFHFPKGSKIVKYLKVMMEPTGSADWGKTWISKALAQFLADEEFIKQHHKFMEFFHHRYNATDWLVGKVKRKVFHFYHPQLEAGEAPFKSSLSQKRYRMAKRKASELFKTIKSKTESDTVASNKRKRRTASIKIAASVSKYRMEFAEKVQGLFTQSIPEAKNNRPRKKPRVG